MLGVVSSRDSVGLVTLGFDVFLRVFSCFCWKLNKHRGGGVVCLNCHPMACYRFCCTRELKFAANVRNIKNVGFLLKHKSKNDNEARKGVRVVASMLKARKGEAEKKQGKQE